MRRSLDRLSRDQEDIAGLYKRLRFAGVQILTLSEGPVSELHIGLKGTMGALYLKDLADKTRRGLRGRVEAGKSGGGNSYGYDVVKTLDESGEAERGVRTINERQAGIIRQIFDDYAAGKSPKAIAHALNRKGVPGPSGKGWGPSTINGNWRRGTGILNNEMYIGRLVWNRLAYIKNPDTGKRVSRLNPESEWIVKDVPELRIIDQELWDKVKERQQGLRSLPAFYERQRRGCCSPISSNAAAAAGDSAKSRKAITAARTARNKGTCENRLTVRQDELEGLVLAALQTRLMDPALLEEFCDEYTAYKNHLNAERTPRWRQPKTELQKLARDKENLIQAIKDGIPASEVRDDLGRITTRREELETLLKRSEEEQVLLHPGMGAFYRQQVANLAEALNAEENRAEAAEVIRSLVDRIIMTPNDNGQLEIDLHGDLAGILSMAANKDRPLEESDPSVQQVKMVAGVGFEPTTFRL